MYNINEILSSVLGKINKNWNSYSVNPSIGQSITIEINNSDNFGKLYQEIYDKHFVVENELSELTKEKIDLTTIYLLRELMAIFHKRLTELNIRINRKIDFFYGHSTYQTSKIII